MLPATQPQPQPLDPTTRQPIPVIADAPEWPAHDPLQPTDLVPIAVVSDTEREQSSVERLIQLYDAAASLAYVSLAVWEDKDPGAEHALRLWASAHGYEAYERTETASVHPDLGDLPAIRYVRLVGAKAPNITVHVNLDAEAV